MNDTNRQATLADHREAQREAERAIRRYRHIVELRKTTASGSERSNLLAAVRFLDTAAQCVGRAEDFMYRADDDALVGGNDA